MDKSEEESLKSAKFNHVRLLKYLEEVKDSLPDIKPEPFLNSMTEFVKIFGIIGSAISFAFKDITTKVATIRKNYAMFPDVEGGLISFIEHEGALGIQLVNTENPTVPIPHPKFKGYDSTTRTINRLMWFFDFVTILIKNIATDKTAKVPDCAKRAYTEALAPHHPLPIRLAAKAALNFAPSRERFLKELFPADMEEDEKYRQFNYALEVIGPIREFLWKYYAEHGIKEIP